MQKHKKRKKATPPVVKGTPLVMKVDLSVPVAPEQVKVEVVEGLPTPVKPGQVEVKVEGKTLYVTIHDWWKRMTT